MQQQWEKGGQGGTTIGFGASVYNCAIVLAYYIESIAIEVSEPFGVVTVLRTSEKTHITSICASTASTCMCWLSCISILHTCFSFWANECSSWAVDLGCVLLWRG